MSESLPRQEETVSDTDTDDKDPSVCPTCGRDDFKNAAGMRVHHAQVHDEKLRSVVSCDLCECEFEVRPNREDTARFCSRDCRYEWMSKHMVGENNPSYRGGKAAVECQWCGAVVEVTPALEGVRKYCSKECFGKDQSENNVGENARNWRGGGAELECEQCGERFNVKRARGDTARFCGYDCMAEAYTEITGPDHPLWKEERDYAPGFTDELKEQIRERDGHRCQGCGLPQETYREKSGAKLDVHHIDGSKDNHAPENLIALCKSCHGRWNALTPLAPDSRLD